MLELFHVCSSQIMMNNNKHKMTLRERKNSFSNILTPMRKRRTDSGDPATPTSSTKTPNCISSTASPSKIKKLEQVATTPKRNKTKENDNVNSMTTPVPSPRMSTRSQNVTDTKAMPAPPTTRKQTTQKFKHKMWHVFYVFVLFSQPHLPCMCTPDPLVFVRRRIPDPPGRRSRSVGGLRTSSRTNLPGDLFKICSSRRPSTDHPPRILQIP